MTSYHDFDYRNLKRDRFMQVETCQAYMNINCQFFGNNYYKNFLISNEIIKHRNNLRIKFILIQITYLEKKYMRVYMK